MNKKLLKKFVRKYEVGYKTLKMVREEKRPKKKRKLSGKHKKSAGIKNGEKIHTEIIGEEKGPKKLKNRGDECRESLCLRNIEKLYTEIRGGLLYNIHNGNASTTESDV